MRIRKIKVKVFTPGNKESRTTTITGPPHVYLTPPLIQAKVEQLMREIEALLPTEEYRMVKVTSRQYNLVHVRSKLKPGDMSEPVFAKWEM